MLFVEGKPRPAEVDPKESVEEGVERPAMPMEAAMLATWEWWCPDIMWLPGAAIKPEFIAAWACATAWLEWWAGCGWCEWCWCAAAAAAAW